MKCDCGGEVIPISGSRFLKCVFCRQIYFRDDFMKNITSPKIEDNVNHADKYVIGHEYEEWIHQQEYGAC